LLNQPTKHTLQAELFDTADSKREHSA